MTDLLVRAEPSSVSLRDADASMITEHATNATNAVLVPAATVYGSIGSALRVEALRAVGDILPEEAIDVVPSEMLAPHWFHLDRQLLGTASIRPVLLGGLSHQYVDLLAETASLFRQQLTSTYVIQLVDSNLRLSQLRGSTSRWVTALRAGLTSFELLESAGRQLSRLIASGEAHPTPEARRALNTLIASFAQDGGPTPQLAATEYGSIELAWVVGDMAVGAIFGDDGTYSVWAEDAPRHELFDVDIEDEMPMELHRQIAELLAVMGANVVRPLPVD